MPLLQALRENLNALDMAQVPAQILEEELRRRAQRLSLLRDKIEGAALRRVGQAADLIAVEPAELVGRRRGGIAPARLAEGQVLHVLRHVGVERRPRVHAEPVVMPDADFLLSGFVMASAPPASRAA